MSPWPVRILLLLAFLLAGSRSMAADIEALEVVDVGLYRARITGEIPAPLTPTGRSAGDAALNLAHPRARHLQSGDRRQPPRERRGFHHHDRPAAHAWLPLRMGVGNPAR
jgi:hypothetical protein